MQQHLIDKKSLEKYLRLLCSAVITFVSKDFKRVITVTKCAPFYTIIQELMPTKFGLKRTQTTYEALFDSSSHLVYDIKNQKMMQLFPNEWIFVGMKMLKTKNDFKDVIIQILKVFTK